MYIRCVEEEDEVMQTEWQGKKHYINKINRDKTNQNVCLKKKYIYNKIINKKNNMQTKIKFKINRVIFQIRCIAEQNKI